MQKYNNSFKSPNFFLFFLQSKWINGRIDAFHSLFHAFGRVITTHISQFVRVHLQQFLPESAFDAASAEGGQGGSIDTSHVSEGYVSASATSPVRLKFQVIMGEQSYNYDLPSDGTPIACPLNMGDGAYTFRVMRNTEGTSYVEVASASAQVQLASEFEPFLHPNVFCDCAAQGRHGLRARPRRHPRLPNGHLL